MTELKKAAEPRGLAATSQPNRRGRPAGSKNKKTLQKEAMSDLKAKIGAFLPKEDYDYLMAVLDGTASPDLRHDLDIFLTMQLKALLPLLSEEIQSGTLTREGTQRSSTVKELLALRFQMEKHEAGDTDNNQYTFINNVFDARGLDIRALTGTTPITVSKPVPKQLDEHTGDTDSPGTVSDELPERQVEVQSGSEE